MAKSKNAAALFEVIQSSRFPNRPDPLRTPRWWFKRRDSLADASAPIVSREIPATVPEPTTSSASPIFTPVAPSIAVETPGGAFTVFSTGFSNAVANGAPAAAAVASVPAAKAAAPKARPFSTKLPLRGVDLQLDPDTHQVTVKVSYYGAIISAFTVIVIVGLAYVVGVKMHRAPVAATSSPSTELLRSRPAHPEVLDVSAGSPTHLTSSSTTHNLDNAEVAANKQPGKSSAGGAAPTPPSPASVDAQRVIGRQYVVIQIYPEQKSAEDAAALLNKNNIPCTIEKGLAGWATSVWYCVVGTTGFDRVRGNSDFDRYESSINRLSDQFAGSSKFKKFEPRAYRWKGAAS